MLTRVVPKTEECTRFLKTRVGVLKHSCVFNTLFCVKSVLYVEEF